MKIKVSLAILALLIFTGCTVVRVHNTRLDGTKTSMTCYAPAWPWQDSAKSIERLTVTSHTNTFNSSLKGLDETQVTSSNTVNMLENIAAGIAAGVVKGLK